jgi:hypothetical protein
MAESHDKQDGLDLSPDELVEDLLGRDRVPPDLITLRGYLGESDARGYHRLFTEPALQRWVDIRDADIVYRERVSAEEGAYGARTVLWVRREATLVKVRMIGAEEESRFVLGPCGEEILCGPPECCCPPDPGVQGLVAGWSVNLSRSGRACC